MPAAAVIPASAAYIKVAAVKRLVVGYQCRASAGGRWSVGLGSASKSRLPRIFRGDVAEALVFRPPTSSRP